MHLQIWAQHSHRLNITNRSSEKRCLSRIFGELFFRYASQKQAQQFECDRILICEIWKCYNFGNPICSFVGRESSDEFQWFCISRPTAELNRKNFLHFVPTLIWSNLANYRRNGFNICYRSSKAKNEMFPYWLYHAKMNYCIMSIKSSLNKHKLFVSRRASLGTNSGEYLIAFVLYVVVGIGWSGIDFHWFGINFVNEYAFMQLAWDIYFEERTYNSSS